MAHFQLILGVTKLTSKGLLATACCMLLAEITGLIVNCNSLSNLASKHWIIHSIQFSAELLLSFTSCPLDFECSLMQLHPRRQSSKHSSSNTQINNTHTSPQLYSFPYIYIFFLFCPQMQKSTGNSD